MHTDTFDRIVRTLWSTLDRRGALRAMGAGLLAAYPRHAAARQAMAQTEPAPDTCAADTDCSDGDLDPCTGAACVDGLCTYFIVDCIPGYACCGNGACCPAGEPGSCLADTDCAPIGLHPCEGVRCEGGACVPFLVTCASGFACCGNGACCPEDGGCFADADCDAYHSPLGARCASGVCVPSVKPG